MIGQWGRINLLPHLILPPSREPLDEPRTSKQPREDPVNSCYLRPGFRVQNPLRRR